MPTKKEKVKKRPSNLGYRPGPLNGRWKGGTIVRADGYVLVRIGIIGKSEKGARYKLQHRIIMEKKIGRPLLRSEIIHHKDGDRSNNKISNLEILTQAEHAKEHYKSREKTKKGRLV